MNKKGKRRRIKIKPLLIILSILIIIVLSFFYVRSINIKRIVINGNDLVKDAQIIEAAKIKDYPEIYRLNLKKIKENVESIPLLSNVKVKRNIFGKLKIDVMEDKVYMYSEYDNKYITSTAEKISEDNLPTLYGIPILVHFTPDTAIEALTKSLNKVDYNIIKMISEIEYSPYKDSTGAIIDGTRFNLKMNDNNTVIIDTYNMSNLNDYMNIYASLELDKNKGILYLDTITDENILFTPYEEVKEEPIDDVSSQVGDNTNTGVDQE